VLDRDAVLPGQPLGDQSPIRLLLVPVQPARAAEAVRSHHATAVPSSSTIWPGIASRVTPSIVVVGATPGGAQPRRQHAVAWQERSTRFRTGGDQVTVLVRMNPARREDLVGTALAVRTEETDADGRLLLEVTFRDPRHAEWALWQLATNAEALAP
jgi:hypothetical protein